MIRMVVLQEPDGRKQGLADFGRVEARVRPD